MHPNQHDHLPERVGDILALRAPVAMRTRLSRDPADKTWSCARCGVIAPIGFVDGWYARRMCACERAALEAKQVACLRAEQRAVQRRLTYTWLGRAWGEPKLAEKTFATFERTRHPDAFDLAQDFARAPRGTLALYGSFGTGKTHLLAAIANAAIGMGRACLFASVVSLFDALAERIERREDSQDVLRRAISTPLLLLDDLDKLKPSEYREETLYKLLNGRLTAGLPLAFSCNSRPDELGYWVGPAGLSRLMMGLVPVPMTGPDSRAEVNR